jgi:hypothetical protein
MSEFNENAQEPVIRVELPSDDLDDMEYAQVTRKRMLKAMMPGGVVPGEAKDVSNIIKILDGIDKQSFNKKKLVIDEKNAGSNAEVAAAAIALSRKFGIGDPYLKPGTPGSVPVADLTQLKPITDAVPGELDLHPKDFKNDPSV